MTTSSLKSTGAVSGAWIVVSLLSSMVVMVISGCGLWSMA